MADQLEQGDGFLGRWSRLKKQQADVDDLQTQQLQTEPVQTGGSIEGRLPADSASDIAATVESHQSTIEPEPEPLTDADMPDIETLDEESNFSGFLSEKVSEKLRRKALQKLFHLPEFNIRDGLNEYDEDYSTFIPMGDTVTYQMKQFIERQKQEFNEALEDQDAAESDSVSAADPSADTRDCSAVQSHPAEAIETAADDDAGDDELGECE